MQNQNPNLNLSFSDTSWTHAKTQAQGGGTPGMWDLVVVGGGATGVGVALDAANRGHQVLLVEAADFAEGASSKSSKMLHGGVRYLAQGNFSLVYEALHERGIIIKNAPHVAQELSFIIPCKNWLEAGFYAAGLKLYDALAGRKNLTKSSFARGKDIAKGANGARGFKSFSTSVRYSDGLFDDARLLMSMLRTAQAQGAVVRNYCKANTLTEQSDHALLSVSDERTGRDFDIKTKAVIYAKGAWSGENVTVSRGSHVVVPDMGLQHGILLPKTPDGRVLFILPWLGSTLIGTTDIACSQADYAKSAPQEDIDWLLATASIILEKPLVHSDVKASFVGYRPLVTQGTAGSAKMSREHLIQQISPFALRIIGGKWTTYRRMAEEALNEAVEKKLLPKLKDCQTKTLPLLPNPLLDHAWKRQSHWTHSELLELVRSAAYQEHAFKADDVLYRRLRVGFTDAALATELTPQVHEILGQLNQRSASD